MNVVISAIINTAFVWLPVILGVVFWKTYLSYKQKAFLGNITYTMLEISIPRNVYKSPQAMEIVIDVLHHLGGGAMGKYNRIWDGAVLYPSSLELVSIEGKIYFFIRCSDKLARTVKTALYSQYPQAEINEVDDYTRYVPNYNYHQDSWSLYGADYKLAKDDFMPIKTYIDYELDKNVGSLDEEQKIDPIAPLLEYLGTIRSGEQIWIQFIVRADQFTTWRSEAKKFIEEVMGRGKPILDDEPFTTVKLTHAEQEQVKAIERSLSKSAFECTVRALYMARKENENKGVKGFFKGPIFKAFNSNYLNAFRKNEDTTYDWIWQDLTGSRYPILQRRFFNDYVERAGLNEGFLRYVNFLWYKRNKPMVLTSEELATLFHIPGRVSETTAVERIEATKSEPPTNLPM
ncbi:MAG: hypothetical protein ACI870_000063 [Crocinitomicaceae bacterium]|jgi:hypothetical protein